MLIIVVVGRTTKEAFAEYFANSNEWIEDGKQGKVAFVRGKWCGDDAIVFTAGIGENSPIIRKLILERLSYLGISVDDEANGRRGNIEQISTKDSKVKAFVIPTDEELMIAQDTVALTK